MFAQDVHLDHKTSAMLLELVDDYECDHIGETMRLALAAYEWKAVMNQLELEVGSVSQHDDSITLFTNDYRLNGLYASGEVILMLWVTDDLKDCIARVMQVSEAYEISTMMVEAVHFLHDLTRVLKNEFPPPLIVGMDRQRKAHSEFRPPEFARIKYI